MEIRFRGTRTSIKTDAYVFGKRVKHIEIVVEGENDVTEKFLQEEYALHLEKAISLIGQNLDRVTEFVKSETNMSNFKVRGVANIVINFDNNPVYYDYYIDVGKLLGGFTVHIKGTSEGELECLGISP